MSDASRVKYDLLAWRPVRAVLASAAFPLALQVLSLAALLLLAANGLGLGPGMSEGELMTFRKTNLTTLVVWGLWWPGMIAAALAVGRAWCTVCPMELVNRVGDVVARKVGWPRARLGMVLRAGWMIVVLYVVLQLLVAGVSMHRVPHYTAIMLLVLLGGAFVAGLVFRLPRSFCHAFCPAGALLSVYGRYTPIQLEARDPSACENCPTKDCIRGEHRHKLDKRSCPSLLRPFNRDASDGCVLCLQCAKVCPHANMGMGIVARDAPVRRKALLKPYEAAFVMVALGFVAHGVIGEVKWLDALFHFVPARLAALVPVVPFRWFEAMWFLALFPLAVWAAITVIGHLAGHRAGLRSLLLAAATGAAPVVAIAHLAKSAAKLNAWGGFLPLALRDPQGLNTLHRISEGSMTAPAAMVGLTVLGWVMLAAILVIAWKAWRWTRQIPVALWAAARSGMVSAAIVFISALAVWALTIG